MLKLLSATDLAIRIAAREGTLKTSEHASRLGGTYVAIEDGFGLIEVANDMAEATARIGACTI